MHDGIPKMVEVKERGMQKYMSTLTNGGNGGLRQRPLRAGVTSAIKLIAERERERERIIP